MKIQYLAVLCLSLFACQTSKVQLLSDRSREYNQNLQWQNLAAASMYFAKEQRRTLMESLSTEFEKNKIVEYGVLDIALDPGMKKGSILVEYNYYGNDQTLKKTRQLQYWEYQDKSWFLTRSQKIQ